jgi:tRNA nucleotidyltransferase (CCA-adding enzyme)
MHCYYTLGTRKYIDPSLDANFLGFTVPPMETISIFSQPLNPQAVEVCRILSEAGYQAFIVGGCVRDLLLGGTPKDWDITTDATPKEVMELFPEHIPTGLQHGTVTVCIGKGVENHFEVTTFRIEGEYSDGRRPDEVFFVLNVEQDLARRDLTINAIAADPITNLVVDPYNGMEDLEKGIIRAVGVPGNRFQEDGLRIMRVARFAARFGYAVDGPTFKGMQENLETLKRVSRERISDELCKTLMAAHPSYGLMMLQSSGALDIACPLLAGRQLPMLPHQDRVPGELETRLAFLYNKLDTNLVRDELLHLKLSTRQIKKVTFLLELMERFAFSFLEKDTALAYKSFMAVVKNHAPDPWEHTLQQFIGLAEALGYSAGAALGKYSSEVVFSKKEMQINGDDLLGKLGMKPGPNVKKVLEECYLDILKYPEHNSKEYLIEHIRKQYSSLID